MIHTWTSPRVYESVAIKDQNRAFQAKLLGDDMNTTLCCQMIYCLLMILLPYSFAQTNISVPASNVWTETGLNLSSGQNFTLAPSGTWSGSGRLYSAIGGRGGYPGMEDYPNMALIGKIGTSVFYIGEGGTLTSPASGILYLGPNDGPTGDCWADNSGSLTAKVNGTNFSVIASQVWTATTINLSAGQNFTISPSGTWDGHPGHTFSCLGDYGGYPGMEEYPNMCLIGKLGGSVFHIGSGGSYTAWTSGNLYVGPNDGPAAANYTENSGALNVTITAEQLPGEIQVKYPNGGEKFLPGQTVQIQWNSTNTSGNVDINYQCENAWINIIKYTQDDGLYEWVIPKGFSCSQMIIEVKDSGNESVVDASDMSFSVLNIEGAITLDVADIEKFALASDNIDPALFTTVLTIQNNSESILRKVSIKAFLNELPMTVYFSFIDSKGSEKYRFGENSSGFLDNLYPTIPRSIIISATQVVPNIENSVLKIVVDSIDGIPVGISKQETVNMAFAKQPKSNQAFKKDPDQYKFPNPTDIPYSDYLKKHGIDPQDPVFLQIDKEIQIYGLCYGMVASAARYFLTPQLRPGGKNTNAMEPTEPDVRSNISGFHLKQFTIDNLKSYLHAVPEEQYMDIFNTLINGEPSILCISYNDPKRIFPIGHAILAIKITEFKDKSKAVIDVYDSNNPQQVRQVIYDMQSKLFLNYDGYNKMFAARVPEDPYLLHNPFDAIRFAFNNFLRRNNFIAAIVSCPVYMNIENNLGQKTGYMADGTWINEIPGAIISRVPTGINAQDTSTAIYAPNSSTYKVNIHSYEDGFMRFEYHSSGEDSSTSFVCFDSIKITPSTNALFNKNSQANYLLLDNDGDGTFDETVLSQSPEIQSATKIYNAEIKKFILHQNYPNPFNPSTSIDFEIPVKAKVYLKIIDIYGREIARLCAEELQPGLHKRTWNAKNYPSGIYFYTLEIDEKLLDSKKITLIK